MLFRSVLMLFFSLVSIQPCMSAMIIGDKGNKVVNDPGWPKGAAEVFNTKHRIAWWEDPPFGGGKWHAECQGDAVKFNDVISNFANIEGVKKRLIVHSGIARSFWLDMNRTQPVANREIETDWVFVIWQTDRWQFQKDLPRGMSAIRDSKDSEPIAEIHAYTGGDIDWKDVRIPEGIEFVDERLESHGFTVRDGRVVEGTLLDGSTKLPLKAMISIESYEPKPEGGYLFSVVERTTTSEAGHWKFKNLPSGSFRVSASCPGYATRQLLYLLVDDQPGWQKYDTELVKEGTLSGRVIDAKKEGLEGVNVQIDTSEYESPNGFAAITDKNGKFTIEGLPQGDGTINVLHTDYVGPRKGLQVSIPKQGIELTMKHFGSLIIEVESEQPRPEGYIFTVEDPNGETFTSSSGHSSDSQANLVVINSVPIGKYKVSARSRIDSVQVQIEPVEIEIVKGAEAKVTLIAK